MKIETVGYQEALRVMKADAGRGVICRLEKGIKPRQKKSERLLSLVAPLIRGSLFRPTDIHAQQEFYLIPEVSMTIYWMLYTMH